jgi:hypothetical protein
MGLSAPAAFVLEKAVGQRRQDDMALPPRQTAAFEMIEAKFVLEFLILLFDGPALMGESDEIAQRRGGGEIDQIVAGPIAGRQFPLAQQPHFGGEPSLAPVVGG